MAGLGGLSKLHKMQDTMKGKADPAKHEKGEVSGEHEAGGESTTTITHHSDGSHSIDGEKHPTHLHMLAALGHKVTGGEKHHIVHHDGMGATSHSIHEDGTHDGPHEHNSAEEAKGALDKFLGEEAQEPEHQEGGEMQQHEPVYGGM